MRLLLVSIAALLVLAPNAHAQFTVDVPTRTIETSKLKIRFDLACPERITGLWYKPYSAAVSVTGNPDPWEFSGQMIQGMWAAQGPIFTQGITSQSWQVIQQDANRLTLRIESQSTYGGNVQAPVRTDYTFFADSSGYAVTRTLYASAVPLPNTTLQVYVLRLGLAIVNAGQYRSSGGVLSPVSFCGNGCFTFDWDQRWTRTQGPGFSSTILYASANPHPLGFAGDYDSNSSSAWTSPYTPVQTFDRDVTWRLYVHFSTTPDNIALEDAVYAWFDGLPVTGAPAPADAGIALAVTPNPARVAARITYALPRDGNVHVDVIDVAGRQVATLAAGARSAGTHVAHWDGRDASGGSAEPGVYFVRARTDAGEHRARFAWLR